MLFTPKTDYPATNDSNSIPNAQPYAFVPIFLIVMSISFCDAFSM